MLHDSKRHEASTRPQRLLPLGDRHVGVDEASADGGQLLASLGQIPECIQILEQLFQKFELDPQVASDLGTAMIDMVEEAIRISQSEASDADPEIVAKLAELRTRLKQQCELN